MSKTSATATAVVALLISCAAWALMTAQRTAAAAAPATAKDQAGDKSRVPKVAVLDVAAIYASYERFKKAMAKMSTDIAAAEATVKRSARRSPR